MEFFFTRPDRVIDVSRPENSIASLDLARFPGGATNTHCSPTINDQEKNRMTCRVFLH